MSSFVYKVVGIYQLFAPGWQAFISVYISVGWGYLSGNFRHPFIRKHYLRSALIASGYALEVIQEKYVFPFVGEVTCVLPGDIKVHVFVWGRDIFSLRCFGIITSPVFCAH